MRRRPPRSTRTNTLFPYSTLFRSLPALLDLDRLPGGIGVLAELAADMRADGSSQIALAKWALLIIRPGTSRHYRLGRVIKALEKVPTGGRDRKSTRLNSSH